MQSEVIFLAIFGWLFARERISWSDAAGIALGCTGAVVVGWSANASGVGDLRSTLAFVLAALSTAGYGVIARRFAVDFPEEKFFGVVWMQTLVSLLLATVLWPLTNTWAAHDLQPSPIGVVAGMAAGIFGVTIPFILYTYASKIVPAKHAAISLNIIPIAGISIGALMGRGLPTSLQYLGGALVLASLFALARHEH